MKLCMQNRYLIPTIMLITAGMVLSTGVSYIMISDAIKDKTHAEIEMSANFVIKAITEWVEDKKVDVQGWSQLKLYQTAVKDTYMGKNARESANQELNILLKNYRAFENVCIANTAGEVIASGDTSLIGKINVADREYFQNAMKGNLYISEPIKSKATGDPVFAISAPIFESNEVKGVFYCIIKLEFFNKEYIQTVRPGKTGYAFIYTSKGTIISHPDKSNISKNINEFPFGSVLINQKSGHYHFKDEKKQDWIIAIATQEQLGWTIGVVASTKELLYPIRHVRNVNILIAIGVILVAIEVVLLLVSSTIKPIRIIAEGLTTASNRISEASHEITEVSRALSTDSSNQAASVEETSSSLEEMAAMTKLNANNARQADQLMKETIEVVERANQVVGQLTQSMTEINSASQETYKIIKTIDEISFQTNLLSLNAAVEAARAGEAGAGFAVVASEVRTLAMRAAEAAKNTSDLIEGTVNKIQSGTEFVKMTNRAFSDVATSAKKVSDLVSEIAHASNEQAEGISQINISVSVIDKVTQQNSANADRTYSSSEELFSQAEKLKEYVDQLLSLISGGISCQLSEK